MFIFDTSLCSLEIVLRELSSYIKYEFSLIGGKITNKPLHVV